jgi:hypothetical protein
MKMRIIDIAAAGGYAMLCISLIIFMSPYSAQDGVIAAASDARASSAIAGYIETVGMPFLGSASASQFCASLQSAGNATISLGGSLNGIACGGAPAHFAGSSDFVFTVSGNHLEVEAWVAER